MDVFEYAKLRNLYSKVYASPEEVEAEVQEVEEVEEESLTEIVDTFRRGAGQIKRAGQKMFGNAQQRNDAVSYEKSVNNINSRNRAAGNNKQPTENDIAAETKGRRKADPNYKPGQGVGSGNKPSVTKPAATKQPATKQPETKPPETKPPATKTTPKPAAQTGNKKADMNSWAKANPKLAAAKAKRDSTRGTSSSSNPLMKKFNAPKPTTKPMKEDFDIILEHLIESGFGFDEAIQMMVEMSAEKRQQILEGSYGETEDSLKDKRMERGGVDGNNRYDKKSNVPTLADKKGKKTEYDGMSAMEKVKASIRSKYGDGAIKDTKKKKED